jgi:hypothetical protein
VGLENEVLTDKEPVTTGAIVGGAGLQEGAPEAGLEAHGKFPGFPYL